MIPLHCTWTHFLFSRLSIQQFSFFSLWLFHTHRHISVATQRRNQGTHFDRYLVPCGLATCDSKNLFSWNHLNEWYCMTSKEHVNAASFITFSNFWLKKPDPAAAFVVHSNKQINIIPAQRISPTLVDVSSQDKENIHQVLCILWSKIWMLGPWIFV